MLFTDSITVYNYIRDNDTEEETWQRTILHGVQYREKVTQSVDTDGKLHVNKTVTITVPNEYRPEPNRTYKNSKEYAMLSEKDNYFTFNYENNLDLIIKGSIDKEITNSYSIKSLRKDYNTVTVKSVADNTNRDYLKNIKVVCE